jgi:ribosomal protein S12 methylthiotransferase accessory factor YcaO
VAQLARAHLGQMAAKLGVDPHTMHIALEAAVREHLQELGEMRPD